MKQLFLVKSRDDRNIRKPFLALCTNSVSAEKHKQKIAEQLPEQAQNLVYIEPIDVSDFDPNKTSAYMVINRTDGAKLIEDIVFDFGKADTALKNLRRKHGPQAQNLISLLPCSISV
jgi:hypothetical protein